VRASFCVSKVGTIVSSSGEPLGLGAGVGMSVCVCSSDGIARKANKKAAITFETVRAAAEASVKRCEDASHSKALRAKFIDTPAPFRERFGSAHASSRRFWWQLFRCVLTNRDDISIEFAPESMPLQE
jgi:hypothetical protein